MELELAELQQPLTTTLGPERLRLFTQLAPTTPGLGFSMSYKRSRATYEADLSAQQSPYVVFGTPLPPLDPEVRDDGSYVPLWKQEVRDERGRKRLHGAFTGGWSAGQVRSLFATPMSPLTFSQLFQYRRLQGRMDALDLRFFPNKPPQG
jgi:hypothetical protein